MHQQYLSFLSMMTRSALKLFWSQFLLLAMLLAGCVDPIDLGTNPDIRGQLVVEGWVNDVDSIHVIKLRTSTANGVGSNTLGVGAQVRITAEDGETALLQEVFPGSYETLPGELMGRAGASYQLQVILANEQQYVSDLVTLPEPVHMSNTTDEFIESRGTTDNGTPFVNYSHNIITELENTETQHFVRLQTIGWARSRVDYDLIPAGPLECWALRNPIDRDVVLTSNVGIAGASYSSPVVNIPADFRADYIVEIFADAMSLEAFAYWEQARVQLARGGGVFDPPFAPVVGNIRNVNDPNEIVLGYFHAYAQTMTRYCYSRTGVPGRYEIPIFMDLTLCTDFYAPAVFELPFDDAAICP